MTAPSASRRHRTRIAALCVALGVTVTAAGCSSSVEGTGDPDARDPADRLPLPGEAPDGWRDVTSPVGLQYSVPPEWTVAEPDRPDAPAPTASDWGSGFATTSNAEAQPGYCGRAGSFRVRTGISEPIAGRADAISADGDRTIKQSLERNFSYGASRPEFAESKRTDVEVGGVIGTWYSGTVRMHGTRDRCTPPLGRHDVIALEITGGGQGSEPRTIVFVMIADREETGVEPEETLERVIDSLRFEHRV